MKRWIVTILLFLLLVSGGAIVNVAVAWGTSAAHRWPGGLPEYAQVRHETTYWSILEQRGLGVTYLEIFEGRSSSVLPSDNGDVESLAQRIPPWAYQAWSRHHHGAGWWLSAAFGWPTRSACWHAPEWRFPDPESELHGGIRMGLASVQVTRSIEAPRALPLMPMWPGFAINTIFYAIILWLLIPGPFVVRRHIRRKRERCPKCGYDLRGMHEAGCPECGWNRQPEATA